MAMTSNLVAQPRRCAEIHGRRVLALVAHVAPAHKELTLEENNRPFEL